MKNFIKGAVVALSAVTVLGIASAESVELKWDSQNNYYEVTQEACDIINTGSFNITITATAGSDGDEGWMWLGLYEYDASGADLYHWGTDGYKITEAGDAVIDETFAYWTKTDGGWTKLSTESTLDGKPTWGKLQIGKDVKVSKVVVSTKTDDTTDAGTTDNGSSSSKDASTSGSDNKASGSADKTANNASGASGAAGSSTKDSSAPKTGDSTAVAATSLLAVAAFAGVVVLNRKKEEI